MNSGVQSLLVCCYSGSVQLYVCVCTCTRIAIHKVVCVYMYTCVCLCIYLAESDSIYSFSPNLKMGVVYFGWKRNGKGCVSYPLRFLLSVVWIGPKKLALIGKVFYKCPREAICVCCVFYTKGDMYKALLRSLGRRPKCWCIWALGVFPSWLKLELLDTSLLYI